MLTQLIELSQNEEVKAIQSEIKKNIQGTNIAGKETRTQIHSLAQKEEIKIYAEQNEEARIQNNEEMLRNIWDNLKHSNIQITWVPEGEEEEQEIESLLEKINERNLPQYGEGNRHSSPGSSESHKEAGPKEEHTKTHHNYITHN